MAQSSVMVSLSSFLWTETLMPPPPTPGGTRQGPSLTTSREERWLLGFNASCYFFSANHGQGSSSLLDTAPCNSTRPVQ